ncbi:MAG: hypothetical protein KDB22_13870 [Planctomycetales bacterium]|nr:hypothetical protein [Planctomycetales bacterium]
MRFILLCLTLFLAVHAQVQADPIPDALRVELRLLSEDIAKIIEKNNGGAVAIGEFGGSVEVVGNAGPGIQLVLADELQKAKVVVDNTNHRFEISGRYQPFRDTSDNRAKAGGKPDQATNLNAVKLVAFLIDKDTGEPLAERPTGRLIFGSETVPSMLGLNVSHAPLRDPQGISDAIGEALKQPQINVQGSRIAGRTGQFAIELIVKEGGKYIAQKVTEERGKPFVPLNEKDIYGVRLINDAPFEVAIDLRIDGVNCFAFSKSKSTHWIVGAGQHTDILGWHRDNKVTTEFKVVNNFPGTAAAKLKLKPSSEIGLITCSFSASWEKDSQRPTDEPEVQGRGTGFGDDIKINTTQVPRTIGQVRDVLSVRYER